MNQAVQEFLVKEEITEPSPENNVDITGISVQNQRSETNETVLYKCDICGFSTKHQQNLRIHKGGFSSYWNNIKFTLYYSI